MRFTPRTEEDLQQEGLIPEGHYEFEVTDAKDKVSKSGNEMIELKLRIWDDKGSARTVFDYLLESMGFKLKHFCESTGIAHKYTDGTLSANDCIGKMAKVWIVQQPPKDGYAAKNSVRDYVVPPEGSVPPTTKLAQASEPPPFDDKDVPF